MSSSPILIGLPIADRPRSYRFYRDALGFDPVGEPAQDGVPEPLQFALNDGVRVMLIPTGGFGWVIGKHEVAPRGRSECFVNLAAATPTGVAENERYCITCNVPERWIQWATPARSSLMSARSLLRTT